MMYWLLKNEGYPPSVVAALLLHGILVWIIFDRNEDRQNQVRIERPAIVATTVQANPQRMRRVEQMELQRQQQRQQAAREQERQRDRAREQERQQQEVKQKQEADRQRVAQQKKKEQEQEQTRKKEQETQQRVGREQEQNKQQAAREQAQREAELARQQAANQQALTEEQQLVAQYSAIIHDLITQNWQLPPGARNGMLAVVQLRLTPTGEIILKEIVQSSGDALFDRSVLQAVDRVGSFPELKELPIAVFERNFRQIALEFTPQDLLR